MDDQRIFGSYFGEEKDKSGDALPLCVASATDESRTSAITASAVVRLTHLQVHFDGEPASPVEREDVEAAILQAGAKAALAHRKREKDLRARMAGLVLAKALYAAQRNAGQSITEGEVLIAQQTLVTAPKRTLRPV